MTYKGGDYFMYKGMRILAIIPARCGSKGLKDKNIKNLNGKPMIAYTIEASKESNVFTDIVVSTDSSDYAKISEEYGAWVPFLRPKQFSTDEASSADVIMYTINELNRNEKKYDYFMLLQPTSPLRTAKDIKNAVDLLIEKNANSVISVCETEHSPIFVNTLDETLKMDNFLDNKFNVPRQMLPSYYRLNGAIYLSEINYFAKFKNFYHENSYAYVMDNKSSTDVDTLVDFEFAKLLMNMKEKG